MLLNTPFDDKDSISTGLFFENPETLFVILNAQCILSEICSSVTLLFKKYLLLLFTLPLDVLLDIKNAFKVIVCSLDIVIVSNELLDKYSDSLLNNEVIGLP